MKRLFLTNIILYMYSSFAFADNNLAFKKSFTPQIGWVNYALAIVLLLVLVFLFAKKKRPASSHAATCQLIEKKYLGNKTVVYVLDYQNQRFLLADNQHALAIHALTKIDDSASEASGNEQPKLGDLSINPGRGKFPPLSREGGDEIL